MHRLATAAVAALLLSATPSFSQNMPPLPDASKTPGVALEVVPDERAATCLSNLIGGTVAEGDAITLEMICTKCIRNVGTAVKRQVYASYGLEGNSPPAGAQPAYREPQRRPTPPVAHGNLRQVAGARHARSNGTAEPSRRSVIAILAPGFR